MWKRLSLLVSLTLCALAGVFGITRLAQASQTWPADDGSSTRGIDGLTVTIASNQAAYFYDPNSGQGPRTVYFNNQGAGAGQTISVSAALSASEPISTFQGGTAFGRTPPVVTAVPWLVTYTIGGGDGLQPAVAFTTVTTGGLSFTRQITFSPDITAPAGLLTSPTFSNVSFTVAFTSTDGGSGVDQTALWYRPPSGLWTATGQLTGSLNGGFPFTPADGEGVYTFTTLITDQVSNSWDGRLNHTVQTVYDVTAPDLQVNAPPVVSSLPISIQFVATETLSGPAVTELWARSATTSTWAATGLTQTGSSGTFSYTPAGPGRTYFGAVADDRAGNSSPAPLANGSASTLYDPDAPSISAVSLASSQPTRLYAPGLTAEGGVAFFNNAVSQQVTATVTWTDTNPASLSGSAAFGMTPTVAITTPWQVVYTIPTMVNPITGLDLTVRDEANLSDTARLTFTQDISAPTAVLTAPLVISTSIPVEFAASDGNGSGLALLQLWTARLPTATWEATGLLATALSGAFDITPAAEGRYAWGVVLTDHVDNVSPAPSDTSLQTVYDLSPPATVVTAPAVATSAPIPVHFTTTDTLSGEDVTELWTRPESGAWSFSGQTLTGTNGTFTYTPAGPGLTYFAAVAVDRAGNRSTTPTGNGDASTLYDPNPPAITSIDLVSSQPDYLYHTGLAATGGESFFNNALSQQVTVTVGWDEDNPDSLSGSPAFGMIPEPAYTLSWQLVYTIPVVADPLTFITLTVSDQGALSDTAHLTFTQDILAPTAVLTAPAIVSSSIAVDFAATDLGSGLDSLELWSAQLPTATWGATGLITTVLSGAFDVTPAQEGRYAWGVVLTDHVSNVSPTPVDTSLQTAYDLTPPDTSSDSPALAQSIPITVTFASTDTVSGVALTELWHRPESSSDWSYTGLSQSGNSGDFYFVLAEPGWNYFATVAVDEAGNRGATPTGNGDTATLFAPDAPVIIAINTASSRPDRFYDPGLTHTGGAVYFNSNDAQSVTLVVSWAEVSKERLEGDTAFGYSPAPVITEPWELSYPIGIGEGSELGVQLLVQNLAGLTDTASIDFVRDITAPLGTAQSPSFANVPFDVDITATDLGPSGVALAELWYRPPGSPTWSPSGLTSSEPVDTVLFSPADGEGEYYFATVVTDHVGNLSAAPIITGAPRTIYDITPPDAQIGAAPTLTNGVPIVVDFVVTDTLGGVDFTELWALVPGSGSWAFTGLAQNGTSGTFLYLPSDGDGIYQLAVRGTDLAGNTELPPPTPDATVVLDRQAPGSAAGSPTYAVTSPISVSWSATDATSAVALVTLWASQPPNHIWQATNLTSTQSNGAFAFTPSANGLHFFATVAEDQADNVELAPTGGGDTSTFYDPDPPLITSASVAENNPYLHKVGATIYYSNGMSLPAVFVVQGTAEDTGSGLERATFTPAFGDFPPDDFSPAAWMADYTIAPHHTGDGQITVEVFNLAGASSTVLFDYLHDLFPPTSTLLNLPAATTDGQLALDWQAADAGSGVDSTELWARPSSGGFTKTGLSQAGGSGIFNHNLSAEGWYYFAAVAVDNVSNRQAEPTGEGVGSVLFDETPPDSAASSVGATAASPIEVTWTVTDALSSVAQTELWVKVGAGGLWTFSGISSTALGGAFDYTPPVEEEYAFAAVAEDVLGNREPEPVGSGDDSTIFDLSGPTAVITAPNTHGPAAFDVQWNAVDTGVGLAPTTPYWLEYRVNQDPWTDWFTTTDQASATFGPNLPVTVSVNNTYTFRVRAWDALNNIGDPASATTIIRIFQVYLPTIVRNYKAFTNGNFESGWTGWTHGGQLAQTLASGEVHGGQRSILLGSPSYQCLNGVPVGSGWVETEFTAPDPAVGSVAIQIWYNMWSQDKFDLVQPYLFDGLQVEINGNPIAVTGLENGPVSCASPAANGGWVLWEVPVPRVYWGQNITLRIAQHNRPDSYYNSWTYIDDIAVVISP